MNEVAGWDKLGPRSSEARAAGAYRGSYRLEKTEDAKKRPTQRACW